MQSGKRLYIGRLARDATRRDVEDFFAKSGPLIDVRVMQGFGFVEFESPRDAEEAVAQLNGREILREAITLDYARDTRPRREDGTFPPRFGGPSFGGPGGGGGGGGRGPPREGRGRLIIKDLPRDVSWQDLKDFGREGGPVSYADLDRDHPGQGIIEYPSVPDAEDAAKRLEGLQIRGQPVLVVIETERFGGSSSGRDDPYARRDDRDFRPRDDYRRDDRDYYGYSRGGRDDYRPRDDYRRDDRGYDRRDDRDRDYRPRDDYRRDDRAPERRDDRDRYDDRSRGGYPSSERRERSPPPAARRSRSRSPVRGGEPALAGEAESAPAPPAEGGAAPPAGSWD